MKNVLSESVLQNHFCVKIFPILIKHFPLLNKRGHVELVFNSVMVWSLINVPTPRSLEISTRARICRRKWIWVRPGKVLLKQPWTHEQCDPWSHPGEKIEIYGNLGSRSRAGAVFSKLFYPWHEVRTALFHVVEYWNNYETLVVQKLQSSIL